MSGTVLLQGRHGATPIQCRGGVYPHPIATDETHGKCKGGVNTAGGCVPQVSVYQVKIPCDDV